MATCRTAIREAMRQVRALVPGDDPTADELGVALEAVQSLILDIHEARGPLVDIDVTANITPGENQRIRVQLGFAVSVSLPNSVSIYGSFDPYDYGFTPGCVWTPQIGSSGPADGIEWRQPADGARIEIVGTTQGLYFYRADLNAWQSATGLTIDAELPFNARLTSAFEALIAERLVDVMGSGQITPTLARRVARGRSALFLQSGRRRPQARGEYL